MRIAGGPGPAATSQPSRFGGSRAMRWSPPELLDTDKYGSKNSGPTKESDIYSMSMTIYEVSLLQYESGRSIESVLGSDRQDPVSRAGRYCGDDLYS